MAQDVELIRLYLKALQVILEAGFGEEWIRERRYPLPSEHLLVTDFLDTYAWVVFVSGFEEQIIRNRWNRLTKAFKRWEPEAITADAEQVFEEAIGVFRSNKKVDAVIRCAKIVSERGWAPFKQSLLGSDYLSFIEELPFIGAVTKYHLAKYIGYDVAKPDRYLLRLAHEYGYVASVEGVQKFAGDVASTTGERIRVVDTVLWRACEEGADLTRLGVEQDEFLDMLWVLHPDVYMELWKPEIKGSVLVERVTEKYPAIAQEIREEIRAVS